LRYRGGDTTEAHGQHYNLTNGEVFSWRDLWPAMAEVLGVEVGPDEPLCLAEFLLAKPTCGTLCVRLM